jgi:hypothetical protein
VRRGQPGGRSSRRAGTLPRGARVDRPHLVPVGRGERGEGAEIALPCSTGRRRRGTGRRGWRRSGRKFLAGTWAVEFRCLLGRTMVSEASRFQREGMQPSPMRIVSWAGKHWREVGPDDRRRGPGEMECGRVARQDARRLQRREDRQAARRLRGRRDRRAAVRHGEGRVVRPSLDLCATEGDSVGPDDLQVHGDQRNRSGLRRTPRCTERIYLRRTSQPFITSSSRTTRLLAPRANVAWLAGGCGHSQRGRHSAKGHEHGFHRLGSPPPGGWPDRGTARPYPAGPAWSPRRPSTPGRGRTNLCQTNRTR